MHVFTKVLEQVAAPTVTAGAYSAGDVIGGLIKLEFQTAGGWCALNDIVVVDDSDVIASLNIHVFNEAPTSVNDNAAYAPSVADLNKKVAKVAISSFDTDGSDRWGSAAPQINNKLIRLPKNALWFYIVDPTGVTLASTTAITFQVTVLAEGG